jgi:hypothetical protein
VSNTFLSPTGFARSFVILLLLAMGGLTTPQAPGPQTLVPTGATWKYLDNGSNQGTAWRGVAFNDSAWASGPAQLGYGDGDEARVVSYGPNSSNKYITTYFRHSFNVSNPAGLTSLTLRVLRDDGAVVYLNGTEVFRSNMPSGTIGYATLASTALGGADETTFVQASVNPALLLTGTNVLAVEVHQSGGTSSDLSFDLQLTGSNVVAVTRGPYLQMGTPSSIVLQWRTNAATESRVRYGTDPANLVFFVDDPISTTEHRVTLSNLLSNTTYYYSVGTTTSTLVGGDLNHFFVTSPAPGTSKPTRIWVLGDSGTADSNAAAVRNAYLNFTGARHTDLWLMLGDNAYENGTDAEYQAAVFNIYPSFLRQSVLWPTIGNHDTAGSTNPPPTLPYHSIFTLPTNGEAGGVASGTEDYYSFDYGNIHFVCLDSMTSDRSPNGAMLTWLTNDLAANTKDWIIAFWHHPPYSKGSHDSDTAIELREMRENALPILEAYGVDLVMAGHSHSYERSFLLDGHYGVSSTLTSNMIKNSGSGRPNETGAYAKPTLGPGPREGAVYVVAGSSGKISGGPLNHPAMFISLNNLGSLVLDIDGNRLDAKYLRETGAVADSFTIIKGETPNIPPSVNITSPSNGASFTAPAGITITANASDNDGAISQVSFYQGATLLGTDTTVPYQYSWSNVGAGNYALTAKATDNLGAMTTSSTVNITVSSASSPLLILAGSIWKYRDNGSNQGTAWRGVAFNDSAWASGAAQLGYGDGDEATVVGYGPNPNNRYVTTYFRRSFNVTNPSAFASLMLRIRRDDGAVVYLNGTEVYRTNMPSGTISYTTLASSAASDDGGTFIQTNISAALLASGTNVIAVEVHQSSVSSSDLSFDLELTGLIAPAAPSGLVATAVSRSRINLSWTDNSTNESGFRIERSTNGTSFSQIATVGANTTSYASTSLQSNRIYYYRVRAYNSVGNSAYSNTASARTLP